MCGNVGWVKRSTAERDPAIQVTAGKAGSRKCLTQPTALRAFCVHPLCKALPHPYSIVSFPRCMEADPVVVGC